MVPAGRLRAEMLSERLQDAERQRDDVVQRLDSYKRAAARVEKDWELQRNNLHVRGLVGGLLLFAACCVLSFAAALLLSLVHTPYSCNSCCFCLSTT